MSKHLIDSFTDEVKGTYQFPLDFSTSGHYVVDVSSSLNIRAQTDSLSELITAKVNAYKALHPTLPGELSDEFITVANIDAAESARLTIGPNKRTCLFPNGGEMVTNPFVLGSAITNVFAHWHGFTLNSEPAAYPTSGAPEPDRLLYNFNTGIATFEEFIPATFTVQVRDSANTTTLLTLAPDQEQAFVFGPGSIRIRIINNDSSRAFYVSDWLLLHD